MYVPVCLGRTCVYVHLCLGRLEEGLGFPGAGVADIVSHPILTVGNQIPSLLQMQYTILAAELSLQAQVPQSSLSSVWDEVQRD